MRLARTSWSNGNSWSGVLLFLTGLFLCLQTGRDFSSSYLKELQLPLTVGGSLSPGSHWCRGLPAWIQQPGQDKLVTRDLEFQRAHTLLLIHATLSYSNIKIQLKEQNMFEEFS